MQHAVDVHRLHGGALQRGEQHAPQRIAERLAEATLQGLGNQRREARGVGALRHLELVGADKFLPIFLDRHCFTLGPANLPSRLLALETSRIKSRG